MLMGARITDKDLILIAFFFQDFNCVNTPKSNLSKVLIYVGGKFEKDIFSCFGRI